MAAELKVKPNEVHIRCMSKKWASCSTRGRITFAIELLDKPQEFRKKVITHELLHLRYRNHGKMFKSVIKAHLSI